MSTGDCLGPTCSNRLSLELSKGLDRSVAGCIHGSCYRACTFARTATSRPLPPASAPVLTTRISANAKVDVRLRPNASAPSKWIQCLGKPQPHGHIADFAGISALPKHSDPLGREADLSILKYVIVGDAAVGKSSILIRLTDDRFATTEPTLGVEFGSRILSVGDEGKRVKVQCELGLGGDGGGRDDGMRRWIGQWVHGALW